MADLSDFDHMQQKDGEIFSNDISDSEDTVHSVELDLSSGGGDSETDTRRAAAQNIKALRLAAVVDALNDSPVSEVENVYFLYVNSFSISLTYI